MRLIRSLVEKSFREGLSKSWSAIKGSENRLLQILSDQIGLIHSAFVLAWTPEQAEDIYTILVNGSVVVSLEVARLTGELLDSEIIDIEVYKKKCRSRQQRIQLLVALDLAKLEKDRMSSY